VSDAQLEVLGHTLTRTIAARLEQAGTALGEYGEVPIGTFASVHEAFDPSRFADGLYGVPSYDDPGKQGRVKVVGGSTPEELWQDEADEALRLAKEGSSAADRAYRERVSLLLNEVRPAVFTTEKQVLEFIDYCHQNALSESDTLNVASVYGRPRDEMIDSYAAAFPNTWADGFYQAFHMLSKAELDSLKQDFESRKQDALTTAAAIPAELWDRGLPLTVQQARGLTLGAMFGLVITRKATRESPTEVTNSYAAALFRWLQTGSLYGLANEYERDIAGTSNQLRRGEVIGDQKLHPYWTKESQHIKKRLDDYQHTDIEPTLHEASLEMSIVGPPIWPLAGSDEFYAQIKKADQKIAGTGFNDCLSRAFTWAFERDFFEAAGLEVWESIKENGWKMLIMAAAIFGAQFVPGLNIAVDIVLIIEFGFDVLSTVGDLKDALTDAGSAKSVVDMEHASAQLAQTLVGTAAKVMLWAIAWAGGKLVNRITKYREGQKFIDEHGDTPDVRKALGDARGDVAKAERTLAAERERLASQQRQAQSEATKPQIQQQQPPKTPDAPPPKPAPPKAPEPPPKPAPPAKPVAPKKTSRTVAEIERDLQNKGLEPGVLGKFKGDRQRLSADIARRVEKLMEHFTPDEVKKLGNFLAEHKVGLTDDAVEVIIDNVAKGKMEEMIRNLELEHGRSKATEHWTEDELAQQETVTIHEGKPPKTSEIVETPGNEALRASLVKRLGQEPPPGYHAHHIIPETQFGEGLNWMRKRLRKAGSDINEADNGVFLAGRGGAGRIAGATPNPELTRLHNSYIHAGTQKEYAYTLTKRLGDLEGGAFLKEVRKIGEEMANGTFKIEEIPRGWKTKWKPGMTAIEEGFEPGFLEE
jgi:hypothetical protein